MQELIMQRILLNKSRNIMVNPFQSLIAGFPVSYTHLDVYKRQLQGEKEKGIHDYIGTYTADYENLSDTESLFRGTSIKIEAG